MVMVMDVKVVVQVRGTSADTGTMAASTGAEAAAVLRNK